MLLHRARKVPDAVQLDLLDLPDLDAPLLFTFNIEPYGTSYDCHNVKNLNRTTAIGYLKEGESVVLQEGKWEGEKLLWVLTRSGTDIAAIPKPFIDYLNHLVKGLQIGATVEKKDPLTLSIEVHGSYKKKWNLYNGEQMKKDYTFGVNTSEEYMLIPPEEILCDIDHDGDTMTVKAEGVVIGSVYPRKVDRIQEMLDKHECITTVYAVPRCYDSSVKLILRYNK